MLIALIALSIPSFAEESCPVPPEKLSAITQAQVDSICKTNVAVFGNGTSAYSMGLKVFQEIGRADTACTQGILMAKQTALLSETLEKRQGSMGDISSISASTGGNQACSFKDQGEVILAANGYINANLAAILRSRSGNLQARENIYISLGGYKNVLKEGGVLQQNGDRLQAEYRQAVAQHQIAKAQEAKKYYDQLTPIAERLRAGKKELKVVSACIVSSNKKLGDTFKKAVEAKKLLSSPPINQAMTPKDRIQQANIAESLSKEEQNLFDTIVESCSESVGHCRGVGPLLKRIPLIIALLMADRAERQGLGRGDQVLEGLNSMIPFHPLDSLTTVGQIKRGTAKDLCGKPIP